MISGRVNKALIKKLFKEPTTIIHALNRLGKLSWISDEAYVKWQFKNVYKRKLNLQNPKTFNEKLQWLKLNNRNSLYTKLVDKYEVRSFIKDKMGEEYLIPILGIWSSVEEIDWDNLPNQFVLKCTHDSGGVIICKDKQQFDIESAKVKLKRHMETNYYYVGREWPYKDVEPRIIAEKFMVDESGFELKDYKFFCFNGKPKILQVDFDREIGHTKNLYDLDWNLLDIEYNVSCDKTKEISKPNNFDNMKEYAEILSNDIPFVRVDFYSINNQLYFGEMTFFPASGFGKFKPESYDELLGSWIELPNIK